MRPRGWLGASFMLMGLTGLARLIGYARDTLIALRFGASPATDAYLVAFTVPNFLVAILSGALNAVVVPKVAGLVQEGREERAWILVASVAIWLAAATLFLIGLLEVLSGPLVTVLAPGFGRPEALLAARLARILLGFVFFSVLAYLGGAVLNAHHRFAYAAIAPSLVSGTAVVTLVVTPNPPIVLLAYALLAGSVFQLFLEALPLLPSLFGRAARPRLADRELARMGRLSLPVLVSSSVGSGNVLVDRIFGSTLAAGSITALAFADRVIQVPFGIFGAAVSTALFPRFAERSAALDTKGLAKLLEEGLRTVVLLTFPIAAGVLALAVPAVAALFRHGAFSVGAAVLTSMCLRAYALALVPYSVNMVLMRAFYALEGTLFVGAASVLMLALNAAADAVLVHVMGAPGLALATVIVEGTYAVVLSTGLRRRLPHLSLGRAARGALPVAVASGLGGLGAALLASSASASAPFTAQLALLGEGVAVLLAVFVTAAHVLGVPEVRRAVRAVSRRRPA